jgi:D-alanine-D-alanine ligase
MADIDVTACKVALLCGGWSDEREISFQSAEGCEKALHDAGFTKVDRIDVAEKGFVSRLEAGGYDVAFIAMHGKYGEDGCVQGLLEILGIPYTFSKVLPSAMAAEKDVAKMVYREAGIPTPEGVTVSGDDSYDSADLVARLGLPLFVKPVSDGSSYGVTKVTSEAALPDAISCALACDDEALVESCVEGMEITVPVIGNDEPRALPVVEVVTGAEFYDLKVKYEPAELHHVIPARLPEDVYATAQDLALRAHVALGCSGASRSDFIVTKEGVPVILETNVIPGMTASSLLPDCARRAGIEFPELCRMFVEYALEGADAGKRRG